MDLLTILRGNRFVSYDISCGNGDGYGDGSGRGYGNGNGWGYGYGDGYGDGYGIGYDNSTGYGYGAGRGDIYGNGATYGYGNATGYGRSSSDECDDSIGNGFNSDRGIVEINGMEVYDIDGMPTAVEAVFGNYLKGYTIGGSITLLPCYVVFDGDSAAHGKTLKEAFRDARAKEMEKLSGEERAARFVTEHPDPGETLLNEELFYIHHILTGSCEFGRKEFCRKNSINLEYSMSISEFLTLTENEYGGEVIKKIREKYLCRAESCDIETPTFAS